MQAYFDEELDSVLLRERRFRMVEDQIRMRSISDKRVLESMKRVPRHLFFDQEYWDIAYGDHPVPIGQKQTSHQPFMVGLMLQALEMRPLHKVLEIGTGSGYPAALMGEVVSELYTVEKNEELLDKAKQRLKDYQYKNIFLSNPKKIIGWPTKGPFDRIIINGCLPCIPKELVKQLTPKGIMIVPVGKKQGRQEIFKITNNNGTVDVWKIAEACNLSPIEGHKITPHEDMN